jgi:hypothetical protein
VLRGEKDNILVRFTTSGADKAKEEADRLGAKLAGWTYQLGSWKEKSLVPVIDDLKKSEEKPAAEAAPPPAPVSGTTQLPASPDAPPAADPAPTDQTPASEAPKP